MDFPLSRRARAMKRSDVRDLLHHATLPGMISLAGGLPAAELFDVDGVRQAALDALSGAGAPVALQYGMTEGQPALREALAGLLAARGIACNADEVLVTTGSQQGLDLVGRALVDEGDPVVVERPSYLAALQALGLNAPRWVPVGTDAQGARVDELDAIAAAARPKLVYVVADFANPTGATMTLERRRRLAEWAARHRVPVLEDDPYGELRVRGDAPPPIAAIARDVPGASDWVGYATTLSKTVAPGLRIGVLRLPPWLHDAVVRLKQAADLHTSSLAQEIAARYLASGRLPAHLARVRAEYARRLDALDSALRSRFGARLAYDAPDGGMFVWARFTDGTDTRALLPRALGHGVMYVPGDAFHVDAPDPSSLRLNFSACTPERLVEGVARLERAHRAAA